LSSLKKNIHTVSIRSREERVVREIIRWGEAPWWPKNSLMRFTRTTAAGPVQEGTRYRQSVRLPFAPSWNVEVKDVTGTSITRSFCDGMFTGSETVSARFQGAGVKVTYEMNYGLNGIVNKVLWLLIFRRMHDANIEMILLNLKKHLEKDDKVKVKVKVEIERKI
jgi:hypothetical protein